MPMRKIAALLLVAAVSIGLLAGCGEKSPAKSEQPLAEHTGNYQTTANINYKDLKATAVICQDIGSCSVSFTAPASLKDMAFVFGEDAVDVSYKGLGFQFDPQSLPGGALARIMTSSINKAMRNDGISVTLTDSGIDLTGMLDVGEFTLQLDRDSGNILKLSVPSEELEIEFLNFRFLD